MTIIRYQCDTCKRQTELTENIQGFTVLANCNITYRCKGKLRSIQRFENTYRSSSPTFENNVENYSKRNILFKHTQTRALVEWKITHNLNQFPNAVVYVNGVILDNSEFTVTYTDLNKVILVFKSPTIGTIHLINSDSSDRFINYDNSISDDISVTENLRFIFAFPLLITDYNKTDVVPTLPINTSSATIRLRIRLKKPYSEEIFCVEYINDTLFGTAWSNFPIILLNNRKNFSVRSKKLLNFTTFENPNLTVRDIPIGTTIKFLEVDYGSGNFEPINPKNVLLLLSNTPHTINDKIYDKIVDIGEMLKTENDYFTFDGINIVTDPTNIETVYPEIQKGLNLNLTTPVLPDPPIFPI